MSTVTDTRTQDSAITQRFKGLLRLIHLFLDKFGLHRRVSRRVERIKPVLDVLIYGLIILPQKTLNKFLQ